MYQTLPFIGATPDGLLGSDAVVEIKCPHSARDNVISTKSVPYLCELLGELFLNKNHDYYFQVQGQMFVSGRTRCIFAILTNKGFVHTEIPADENVHFN